MHAGIKLYALMTNVNDIPSAKTLAILTHTVIQTTTSKPTEETNGNVQEKNNKEKDGESMNGECHVDTTLLEISFELRRPKTMTCQNRKRRANPYLLNHKTEVTGIKLDSRGALEEYKNGKEGYGEFGKLDQKKPTRGSSKKHERVPKRHRITKCYDMLQLVLIDICSLFFGKRILRPRDLIFICVMCLVKNSNGTCSASISTVKEVNNCPESKEEWNERAFQMNCLKVPQNCTSPEKFQYHCLPTEKRHKYVELCSPIKRINCHCAMFDTVARIVQYDNDKRFRGRLENCSYLSNAFNVLKAKGCFGIFVTFNSTKKSTKIPSEKFPENVEHNKTNTYMTSTEGNDDVAIAAAVIVPVVAVALVGIIGYIVKTRRRRNGTQHSNDEQNEMQQLNR